jgi:hypothetical protein
MGGVDDAEARAVPRRAFGLGGALALFVAACGGGGAASPRDAGPPHDGPGARADGVGARDGGARPDGGGDADDAEAAESGANGDGAAEAPPTCQLPVHGLAATPTSICPDEATFAPLAARNDWRVQDYPGNLGATAVQDGRALSYPGLLVTLALNDPQDPQAAERRKGEIVLDLPFVPGLDTRASIDLGGHTIAATVQVPKALADGRNGLQLFAKDEMFRSQYGPWVNLKDCGATAVSFAPGADGAAFTDPDFDATKIRTIGLKVALADASSTTYRGPLQVTDYTITPEVALAQERAADGGTPRTSLVGAAIDVQGARVRAGGEPAFVVGGNWRIIDYGQNFGATAWYPLGNGVGKHRGFVACELERFQKAGVRLVRVGLVDDGRAALDDAGNPQGSQEILREDVRALLALAQRAGVAVELVLADFLLASPGALVDGVLVRGRRAVIEDDASRAVFFAELVDPLLADVGLDPALFAIDCLNEPEWFVAQSEGGGWEGVTDLSTRAVTPLARAALDKFVAACVASVRTHAPGKLVTIGVSGAMAPLGERSDLDYLAIHYYPWMGPFADVAATLPAATPWLLEEYPTVDGPGALATYLDASAARGASGALLWNLTPLADMQTFSSSDRDAVLQTLEQWSPP